MTKSSKNGSQTTETTIQKTATTEKKQSKVITVAVIVAFMLLFSFFIILLQAIRNNLTKQVVVTTETTIEPTKAPLNPDDYIKIFEIYTGGPNSVGGVDLHISWKNISGKTIKYLTFIVIPYNAVGDPVACEVKGVTKLLGKVTGPVYSGLSHER